MSFLLSFGVNLTSEIEKIKKQILEVLQEDNKHVEPNKHDPHISVGYLDNISSKDFLNQVHKKGVEFKPAFKYDKIELFPGSKKDFIVLTLKATPGYYSYIKYIGDYFHMKQFQNGIKPHISLFSLPKKDVDKGEFERLKNKLNIYNFSLSPTTVQLWGEDEKIDSEIKLASYKTDFEREFYIYSHKRPIALFDLRRPLINDISKVILTLEQYLTKKDNT